MDRSAVKTRAVAGEDEGGARARVCGGACAALRDEANAPGDERFVASQNSSNCQIHDDARWLDLLSSKLEIRSIADGARVAGARFDFFQSRRGVALVAKRLKRRQRLVKLILHVQGHGHRSRRVRER